MPATDTDPISQPVQWVAELVGVDATLSTSTQLLLTLAGILLFAVVLHVVLHKMVLPVIKRVSDERAHAWLRPFFAGSLFSRLVLVVQGLVVHMQALLWLTKHPRWQEGLLTAAALWMLLFGLLTLYALFAALLEAGRHVNSLRRFPLRGIFQAINVVCTVVAVILMLAVLLDKSPVILFSGLGAMTAVLMLVFKDPILGLVASIQLSANKMLEVGDWLEMAKYGADGTVTDIGLTTVKVCNWDNTVTTIPTYALISDSFKNWRGMSESGGRRIKRSIYIDVTSVRFLDEADMERLRRIELLAPELERRVAEVRQHNAEKNIDPASPVNGRRLTNLGTFRAYLVAFLRAHPHIRQDMTLMVRQMPPGSTGQPLELYAFSTITSWVEYEGLQSDIFDHVFAVLPEFGLRVHQEPTGYDLRRLAEGAPVAGQLLSPQTPARTETPSS